MVGVKILTAGAWLSKVMVSVSVAVLPAASCATIDTTLLPVSKVMPLAVQVLVPTAVPVAVEPLILDQVTEVTAKLSVDVPLNEIGEVEAFQLTLAVGVKIEMSGAIWSPIVTLAPVQLPVTYRQELEPVGKVQSDGG